MMSLRPAVVRLRLTLAGPPDARFRHDTSGGASGTNGGGRTRWKGSGARGATKLVTAKRGLAFWGLWLGLLAAVALANATSSLTEAARFGEAVQTWKPFVWEITSAVGVLVALPGLAWLVSRHPFRRRGIARQAVLHIAAALAFSAVHIATMVTLREAIYALVGETYSFDPWMSELIYELRKDLAAYLLIVVILNLMLRAGWIGAAPNGCLDPEDDAPLLHESKAEQGAVRPSPRLILRDGAQSLIVDPKRLLAVKAAGNYVELLQEGAKPRLLRATLAQVEAATRPHGFLRIHRSWIVAGDRVRAVVPTRAGDFRIDLDCGLQVPGSRRYRNRLKGLPDRTRTSASPSSQG